MKNTILTGAAAAVLAAPAFAGAPVTYTPEPAPSNLGLSGDISLAYQNQYEFRGIGGTFNDYADDRYDEDTDVIIGAINAQYAFTENFSLVTGFRVDSQRSDYGDDQEDFHFGAKWATECYSVEVGYRHLDFNEWFDNTSTDEIYVNLGTVCPWTGANLNLFWAHDLDETEGDYLELNANKTFEINEWAGITLYGGVSYSFDYWERDSSDYQDSDNSSDFNHWFIGLAVPLKATEYLTVTPYVTYTDGLSALEFDDGAYGEEDDEVLWGVKASVNF